MVRSRILVATSSPWASQKLAEPLTDLIQRLEAQVLIAHVAQVQDEDEHEADAKARGQQTLDTLLGSLRAQGIDAEGLMLFADDVAKAIMSTAKARQCSLIVLGLSGKGIFKRLIAGDVPSDIIRSADLPVLLLPANWQGMI